MIRLSIPHIDGLLRDVVGGRPTVEQTDRFHRLVNGLILAALVDDALVQVHYAEGGEDILRLGADGQLEVAG